MEDYYRLKQPYCIKLCYRGYIILDRNYDKLKKSGSLKGSIETIYLYDDNTKPWSSIKNCNDYHLKLEKINERLEKCIYCGNINIDLKCMTGGIFCGRGTDYF